MIGRRTDRSLVKCGECGWVGMQKDCMHGYSPVLPDDVEPMEYCPKCRAEEPQPFERKLKCPECGGTLVPKIGAHGIFYGCVNWPECLATHGAHQSGDKMGQPLGTPANKETREWRVHAHTALDVLWKKTKTKRKQVYAWLRKEMNLKRRECHISRMNIEQCKRVVELATIRAKKEGLL